jgi:hypothetical protein
MVRDTGSGLLLITGALAGVVVMGLHPTAIHVTRHDTIPALAPLGVLVHSLALIATPVVFLGLLGLSRRLEHTDLAIAALVAFGFGAVATLIAALANGFVLPGVAARIVAAPGSNVPHAFMVYTGLWNQAFAKAHLVAYSVGILLWSAAILSRRGRLAFSAATAIAGAALGGAVLLAFFSGHLRLDVHGSRIVYFSRSAWLAGVGIQLCLGGKTAEVASAD